MESDRQWARIREKFKAKQHVPHSASTEGLELPKLGFHLASIRHGRKQWESQTYADFADRTKKKHTNVKFTKEIMDEAFRVAASKFPKSIRDPGRFEKMVQRVCYFDVVHGLLPRLMCPSVSAWVPGPILTGRRSSGNGTRCILPLQRLDFLVVHRAFAIARVNLHALFARPNTVAPCYGTHSSLIPLLRSLPVDHIPNRRKVLRLSVLILQVISMLPRVNA